MYSQCNTPLFTALVEYAQKNPIQFHIPGHKKGKGMEPQFRNFIGKNALSIDLINISPLDDLHQPKGIIKQAQDLAADAFGADYTFFSIQGTTSAIITMVMSVCRPNDKILVPRNVHKSILTGIIFSGAIPIFMYPEVDPNLGISYGVTPEAVKKTLKQHPDAKAVLVSNPTYYGVSSDLGEIVAIAHSLHIPVLVDEAHGAHFHFHDKLPLSAMQAGADMSATSIHKLGGSLTQSSILNIRGNLISQEHVQTIISMLTTTSTSYLLLASLDAARKSLATEGKALLEKTIHLAEQTRSKINNMNYLYCIGQEILDTNAAYAMDPTKLLVSVKNLGITGFDAETWLRERCNIEVEISDLFNILCIITPADTEEDVQKLINALQELSDECKQQVDLHIDIPIVLPDVPVLALTPREAFYSETEIIPFEGSAGRIIAEFVIVYPLGIPIFIPGEIITEANLLYTKRNMEAGLSVQGAEDSELQFLRVIKEQHPVE